MKDRIVYVTDEDLRNLFNRPVKARNEHLGAILYAALVFSVALLGVLL